MRTRIRSREIPWSYSFTYVDQYAYQGTLPTAYGKGASTERLVDDPSPRTTATKYCEHSRAWFAAQPVSTYYGWSPTQRVGLISGTYVPSVIYYPGTLSPSNDNMRAIANTLSGRIGEKVKLYNFIAEIPQSLNLWTALTGPMKTFGEFARRKTATMRNGSVAAANTVLAAQFGAIPLMADLYNLVNLNHTIHNHVKKLNKIPSTGWQQTSFALSGQTNPGYFGTGDGSIRFEDTKGNATGIAWAKLQRLSAIPATPSPSMYADALGVGNVAGALWEATPFSFVCDWFWNVGSVLDGIGHQFQEPQLRVKDAGYWMKATASAKVRWYAYRPPDGVSYPIIGTALGRSFFRNSGLPMSSTALTGAGLSQGILGTMLALQRI